MGEKQIPVFTVLKNNCILKNIYLLDNPPSISSSSSEKMEEILVVGRHPDCNIKLEHPSISRFHLRIHTQPHSRSLFVTDLSSVHGTWISGKRVEPGVRMKLNEGDTLHLGASSRLYRLNWVPLSCAYDIDNPFVPQLDDDADKVDEETEKAAFDQEKDILSNRNDQVETMSDSMDSLERLFSDEDLSSSTQKLSPTAPPMPEDLHNSCSTEEVEKNSSPGTYNHENDLIVSQPCQLDKVNSTPSAHLEVSGMNSGKRSGLNIWSRRGKLESVRIDTSRLRGSCARIQMSSPVKSFLDENLESEPIMKDLDYEDENFTPDKENTSPDSILFRSLKKKDEEISKNESSSNTHFSSVDQDEEIFTPDKENMTPNSRLLRSKKSFLPKKLNQEKAMFPTLEASQNRKVFQEVKSSNSASKRNGGSLKKKPAALKAREDRDPFRPLPVNSDSSRETNSKRSVREDTMRGSKSINYPKFEENNAKNVAKNKWTIVVDTACLLNKKSRKELELMRGLRGTTLVIPRIVIRELDCMLRRAGFFTRTTEVSSALKFIDECMAVAKWWIHVQCSAEEGRLIPPTPPSTTHWFGEDMCPVSIGSSTPFSPYSLQEIVTPTAGDHILDYALYCKRIRKDGQVVLLTDDVTLKIKAMAEGVMCETAQEFRKSLVNPFSTRCLYSNSSPFGPTWSCEDDAVLKEKYYPSPSKKVSKSGEGAKGLKLILLHNSNFRQIKSVR